MITRTLLSVIALVSVLGSAAQQYGSIKDSRDGKIYKTVKIGSQTWMAENLNVSKFRNGDPILEAKTYEEWKEAGEKEQPAWCYYNNDPRNGAKYGKLYNWYAINDPRGLSPKGWHVPSKSDWKDFTNYLGGELSVGMKIKSKTGWITYPVNYGGNDQYGFKALPAGYSFGAESRFGRFYGEQEYGAFWSSTETDSISAFELPIGGQSYVSSIGSQNKDVGLSVRCIKD
jgi:uncharacterized protein (TIGR02145 family)